MTPEFLRATMVLAGGVAALLAFVSGLRAWRNQSFWKYA